MSDKYKVLLYVSATVAGGVVRTPVGEPPFEYPSLDDARAVGMSSSPVNGPKPDYFEIVIPSGALQERWVRDGSQWKLTHA